jgi:hypothetical protein
MRRAYLHPKVRDDRIEGNASTLALTIPGMPGSIHPEGRG